jgi:hypothetical protein
MESIQETYDKTIEKATSASKWYQKSTYSKKKYSKRIRTTSIILFGLGGIIPLINAFILENGEEISILNLGYISVALAGTLLLLDKFFGFSSAWIRYIKAEMEISKKIKEFDLKWKIETYGKDLNSLPDEEAKELLRMLSDFLMTIEEIVLEETNKWVLEFQSNIAELQKSIDSKVETSTPGSIKVTLTNISNHKNLKIKLDNVGSVDVKRNVYLFQGVSPGHHMITLKGEVIDSDKSVESAEVVLVEAGKLVEVTVSLES